MLNWLALAGWGVAHDHDHSHRHEHEITTKAPNSTTIFTLPELVEEVSPLLDIICYILTPLVVRLGRHHTSSQRPGSL